MGGAAGDAVPRVRGAAPAASSDPLAVVARLVADAQAQEDPAARAAILAGARAVLAGLSGPSTPDRAAAAPGEASAAKRVLDLEAERRRRAGG